jgi:hypothetical protein
MTDLNTLSAILAILIGTLAVRAYYPLFTFKPSHSVEHGRVGLFILVFALLARLVYWDVAQHVVGWMLPGNPWASTIGSSVGRIVNTIFNLLCIYGFYHILTAVLLLVDEDERSDWNFLTVAFYPDRDRLIVRLLTGRWFRRKD